MVYYMVFSGDECGVVVVVGVSLKGDAVCVKCSLYTGMLLPAAPIAGDVFSDQAVSPVCCNLWACLLSSAVNIFKQVYVRPAKWSFLV